MALWEPLLMGQPRWANTKQEAEAQLPPSLTKGIYGQVSCAKDGKHMRAPERPFERMVATK